MKKLKKGTYSEPSNKILKIMKKVMEAALSAAEFIVLITVSTVVSSKVLDWINGKTGDKPRNVRVEIKDQPAENENK